MPIPTTNVSASSIQTEFGGANPISLSEYYRNNGYVPSNQPASATDGRTIPVAPPGPAPYSTAPTIAFGMFRGQIKSGATTGNNYSVSHSDVGDTGVAVRFKTDGTVEYVKQTSTVEIKTGPNGWYDPTTTSVGNLHWVKFTRTSGAGIGETGAGSWLQLNAERQISNTASSAASTANDYRADVSTSADGLNIVGTHFISLSATSYGDTPQ